MLSVRLLFLSRILSRFQFILLLCSFIFLLLLQSCASAAHHLPSDAFQLIRQLRQFFGDFLDCTIDCVLLLLSVCVVLKCDLSPERTTEISD
jgi:hypothetical protein